MGISLKKLKKLEELGKLTEEEEELLEQEKIVLKKLSKYRKIEKKYVEQIKDLKEKAKKEYQKGNEKKGDEILGSIMKIEEKKRKVGGTEYKLLKIQFMRIEALKARLDLAATAEEE